MAGVIECALAVAWPHVDGLELRQLGTALAAAGDSGFVVGTDDLDATKVPQTVSALRNAQTRCERPIRSPPR